MYTLCLQRAFTARHFLVGGDWGPENTVHSHAYRIEVRLAGRELDPHGYLVDLEELERVLETCLDGFRDRVLNELPAFAGANPSLERFARILWGDLGRRLPRREELTLAVRLWENEAAWAAYEEPPGCASAS